MYETPRKCTYPDIDLVVKLATIKKHKRSSPSWIIIVKLEGEQTTFAATTSIEEFLHIAVVSLTLPQTTN